MKSWKDAEGREWAFRVDMLSARKVKDKTGWDLPNIFQEDMAKLAELTSDKFELLSVWLVLLEDQMTSRKLTEEDFGRGLIGDAVTDALDAFMESLVDFFPNRQREQMRHLLAKMTTVADRMADVADQQIADLDVDVLTKQALDLLESSASNRGDSQSAN